MCKETKAHNEGKETKTKTKPTATTTTKTELARQSLKEQIQAQAKKQFPVIGIIQQWTKTKTNNNT